MSDLPSLTCCICTYKRPWYAIMTLQALIAKVNYAGQKRFLVADGGSCDEDLFYYREILKGHDFAISVTDNLSEMMNSCARESGDVWLVTLDDFMPLHAFDITPDVRFLLSNPDVGAVRMGRLAFWEHYTGLTPEERMAYRTGWMTPPKDDYIEAELRMLGGLHWWVFHKQVTTHPYICSINTTLYHRRFWDAYGDIAPCPPDNPGVAETRGASRYNETIGPTIAVPMRFGEDGGPEFREPFWHYGMYRTDEYAKSGGRRL